MSHTGIDPELGRIYFAQGADLHASDRGGFCPFPHPPKRVVQMPAVVDGGKIVQVMMPGTLVDQLFALADQWQETDRLLESQREAARRFKQSKVIYASSSRPRQRFV